MADQILTPEGPGDGTAPADPFAPQENPLVSEQMAGAPRPGGNFEERALRQIRGTGPHVTRGGKVDQLIGTAGRMNQLQHGQQGPGATSGEAQRQQLLGARAARSDPYRDQLHYRKDFGTSMSDTVHGQATAQQAKFHGYIADTNKQLDQYATQLQTDRVNVNQAYADGQKQVESSYQTAMSGLPDPTTLSKEYNDWLKNDNHTTWVYTGSGPENEGQSQGAYKLPPDQLRPFFDMLVNEGGMQVYKNRIYVNGRGQEVHDQLRTTMQKNKVEYYQLKAPEVAEYNSQISTARNALGVQRGEQLNYLQKEYSDATTQISQGEGAVAGRRTGLQKEVNANKQDLAEVRKSYGDRLARIDETLAAMVGGASGSRSEAQPVRQIEPRMISAQQEQPA